jgi:hypothetical protein
MSYGRMRATELRLKREVREWFEEPAARRPEPRFRAATAVAGPDCY